MEEMEIIKDTWNNLCLKNLLISENLTNKWWEIIVCYYSQTHRYYHTTHHLLELITFYYKYENKIRNKEIFLLSIYFHDVIYIPLLNNNEIESIQIFQQFSNDCIDYYKNLKNKKDFKIEKDFNLIVKEVIQYIEVTIHHKVNQNNDSFDLKLFCDIDMAILGSRKERYIEYSQQVLFHFYNLLSSFSLSKFIFHF